MKRYSTIAALAALGMVGASPLASHAQEAGQSQVEPIDSARIVVQYEPGTSDREQHNTEKAVEVASGTDIDVLPGARRGQKVIEGLDPRQAQDTAEELSKIPGVAYAEPSIRMHTMSADPYADQQWNLGSASPGGARLTQARAKANGSGQTVAVIDTGILPHRDLTGRMVNGYDFISDPDYSNDGNGRDADPTDPGDWNTAGECGVGSAAVGSSWHGTHVAGVIGALTDNGVGIAGAAPGARVMPLRALGVCGGDSVDVASAISWAAGGSVPGAPANTTKASVINLSLGADITENGLSCPRHLQDAIDDATRRGSVVVAAAGNDAVDAKTYAPAACENVIIVGSVGKEGSPSSFSNYGSRITLSAPGGNGANSIISTSNTGTTIPGEDTYVGMQGTSQAAPHVSAAVAMLKQLNPGLTYTQARDLLTSTARPVSTASGRGMGAGILDASAALDKLSTPPAKPEPTTTPTSTPTATPSTPTSMPTTPAPTPTMTSPAPTTTPTPTTTSTPAPTPTTSTTAPVVTKSRIAGADRVQTAIAASRRWWGSSQTVYLASSAAFPDALSAAPAAARSGAPLLLTEGERATSPVIAEILRLGARRVVIVGGTSVVSEDVQRQMKALGVEVERVAGADRYATSAAVAASFGSSSRAYLASGLAFPDATSAGAAAAREGVPLLLTDPHSLPASTSNVLRGISSVRVVGGPAIVSEKVSQQLGAKQTDQVFGADRYATSAALSRLTNSAGSDLIVASGQDWPDALVAGPVSKKANAGMVLSRSGCVPTSVRDEILRISPKSTFLFGGTAVLSDSALSTTCR